MIIYRIDDAGTSRYAEASGEQLYPLTAAPWHGGRRTGRVVPRPGVPVLAPVTPSKIVCVGRNYADHAREVGGEVPTEPLLFLKPPSAVVGRDVPIHRPSQSKHVEHEGEIGVVIGARARGVSATQARAIIFGITCVNDVTARDLQRHDVQFTRAKSFDTFCPVGPCVVTELELDALEVSCRVNGVQRQHGAAQDMAFPIPHLVAYISDIMTLEPGDLICTGTPAGVGPLLAGDSVEVEIPGVGTLVNPVV